MFYMESYIEIIDYFIEQFKAKEEFEVIQDYDEEIASHHFYLKNNGYTISIGYINSDKRVEIYSFEKLFDDVIIIRSREKVHEILEWLTFNIPYYN